MQGRGKGLRARWIAEAQAARLSVARRRIRSGSAAASGLKTTCAVSFSTERTVKRSGTERPSRLSVPSAPTVKDGLPLIQAPLADKSLTRMDWPLWPATLTRPVKSTGCRGLVPRHRTEHAAEPRAALTNASGHG